MRRVMTICSGGGTGSGAVPSYRGGRSIAETARRGHHDDYDASRLGNGCNSSDCCAQSFRAVSVQSDAAMRAAGNHGPSSSILVPSSCKVTVTSVTAAGTYRDGFAAGVYARYGRRD